MKSIAAAFAFAAAASAYADQDVEKVLLRDFQPRGQATMDRVLQDGLQRLCTETDNKPPAEVAKVLEADQLKSIAFPSGSLIGDWQRGEKIAQGGRGMTWSDKAGAPADGSCYNCHQLSPTELSYGTLGPSPPGLRQDAWQRPGCPALRLRQDL
jgi:sulfur-oxidizing protein SoxX